MAKSKEPDLIEKIAYGLPLEVRAEFLNEMRYLRSLPENDELLRILRAMQFLTLLMEQVPMRMLNEREKLENTWREVTTTAKRLEKVGSEYYQQINQQLIQLHTDIAAGIRPKAIVGLIADDLKKQFALSTIPTVAKELATNAEKIKTATHEYTRASDELSNSWRSTANEAQTTIAKIRTTVSEAFEASRKTTKGFSIAFDRIYAKALWILCSMALVAGIMVGVLIFDRMRPVTRTVYEIPHDLMLLLEERKRERLSKLNQETESKPQR